MIRARHLPFVAATAALALATAFCVVDAVAEPVCRTQAGAVVRGCPLAAPAERAGCRTAGQAGGIGSSSERAMYRFTFGASAPR